MLVEAVASLADNAGGGECQSCGTFRWFSASFSSLWSIASSPGIFSTRKSMQSSIPGTGTSFPGGCCSRRSLGAIKKAAGFQPFQELRRYGVLPLGEAATTSAGRLPFKGIIHVAGLNTLLDVFGTNRPPLCPFRSCGSANPCFRVSGLPLIGAGTGGLHAKRVISLMSEEISSADQMGACLIVIYEKKGG